jgi:hypothetical protein
MMPKIEEGNTASPWTADKEQRFRALFDAVNHSIVAGTKQLPAVDDVIAALKASAEGLPSMDDGMIDYVTMAFDMAEIAGIDLGDLDCRIVPSSSV